MRIWENGKALEIAAEDLSAMEHFANIAAAEGKYRPLTEAEVSRMLLARQVNTLTVDDNTAVCMKAFYPTWDAGVAYSVGYKVQYDGRLWRTLQAHTSQNGWEPENTPALWEQINASHAGTLDDPIPYSGNMALQEGLYYYQDGAIYLCTRDTINPICDPLRDLVGLYVEVY